MWRAARLEPHLYEEVEHEPASIAQAWIVVLLAAGAGALGSYLAGLAPERVFIDLLEPLVLWLGGSVFTYMVGASFLRGPHTATDYREVLRTTGFAFAPGLLRVLACLPEPWLARTLPIAGDLWMLAAGVVAVRQALDFTTPRAIATFGVAYALLWLSFEGLLFSIPL
jgi:hypothetical protein